MWQIYAREALWYIFCRRVMPDVGLMCVEGFADDEPAWAALIQMDLVSVVETDEGRGRRGFLFSPQVSLYFDIFTASLNLLCLFFSTHTARSALRFTVFLLTSFHIPFPKDSFEHECNCLLLWLNERWFSFWGSIVDYGTCIWRELIHQTKCSYSPVKAEGNHFCIFVWEISSSP